VSGGGNAGAGKFFAACKMRRAQRDIGSRRRVPAIQPSLT